MNISIICFVAIVSAILCSLSCHQKQKEKSLYVENNHYTCCNVKIATNRKPFIDSLSKYLFVGYYKGGEVGDYSMNIEYYMQGASEYITTSIKFYSNEFNKDSGEKILQIIDTIIDYLPSRHLVDSLKIHNPLVMNCIEGYDGHDYNKGKVDVYYKSKDSTNCFSVSDTNNTLVNPHYLFYMSIFNNSAFFPILLKDIQKRRKALFDSLIISRKTIR